ncbi:hypothetical protein [Rothia dentocariosa]
MFQGETYRSLEALARYMVVV